MRGGSSGGTAGLRAEGSIGRPEASVVWMRLRIWHSRTERLSDSALCASSSALAADWMARDSVSKKRLLGSKLAAVACLAAGCVTKSCRARTTSACSASSSSAEMKLADWKTVATGERMLPAASGSSRKKTSAAKSWRNTCAHTRKVKDRYNEASELAAHVARGGRVDAVLALVVGIVATNERQHVHGWIGHQWNHVRGLVARVHGNVSYALGDDGGGRLRVGDGLLPRGGRVAHGRRLAGALPLALLTKPGKRRGTVGLNRHDAKAEFEEVVDHVAGKGNPTFFEVPRKGVCELHVVAAALHHDPGAEHLSKEDGAARANRR